MATVGELSEEYSSESERENYDYDDDDEHSVDGADGDEERQHELDQELIREFHIKINEMQLKLAAPEIGRDQELQAQFIRKYQRFFPIPSAAVQARVQPIENRNFLYRMASGFAGNVDAPWLIQHLVETYPDLLCELDQFMCSALLVAIIKLQRGFINAVLESKVDDIHLDTALASHSSNNENCIHVAVTMVPKDLDSAAVIRMIERASNATLAAQDNRGLTPLHRAVDYARCTPSQVAVVKTLIRCGDSAFDKVTGKPDCFSVYRYHMDTRRRHLHAPRKAEKRPSPTPTSMKGPAAGRTSSKATAGPANEAGGLVAAAKMSRAAPEQAGGGAANSNTESQGSTSRNPMGDSSWNDWEKVGASEETKNKKIAQVAGEPKRLKRTPTVPLASAGSLASTSARGISPMRLATAEQTDDTSQQATPNTPVSLAPKDVSIRPKRPRAGKSTKSSSRVAQDPAQTPSLESAEVIARELKLHYLRSTFDIVGPSEPHACRADQVDGHIPPVSTKGSKVRTHNSAIEFLFGENKEDRNICFDFPPSLTSETEKINFKHFKESYDRLKFDEVLRYVHFGPVELENLNLAVPRRRSPSPAANHGAGRTDMVRFFEWLYNKGVRTIIKVVVDDRKGTPHGDEAIEAALSKFNVEILDWRKVDMDPRAIWRGCQASNLWQIHYWWSGNNAILRACSEVEGLIKLENLRRICLHQAQKGLDSASRTEQNVSEFRARLQALRSSGSLNSAGVLVDYIKMTDAAAAKPRGRVITKDADGRSQIDTHRWLTIMDTFADCISRLRDPPGVQPNYMTDETMPSELRKDVKVALLDDGANFMHKAIKGQLENGRSFDSGYENLDLNDSTPGPFHGSTTGHGTYMAYMIGRVCPSVKIFVCKMNMIRQDGGTKAKFTAKSAAEALEFATNRGFDIISMSWTVQSLEDDHDNTPEDISRLRAALDRAVNARILLFCSAPDIGAASSHVLSSYYPFGYSAISDSIFKIGAAKADGTMYGWAGDPRSVDFILPGHNVELREGDRIHEEDDIPKTGSSVATALAAGLAALIIHCVRLGAVYSWHRRLNDGNAVNEDSVRAIKRHGAMREALMRISKGYTDKDRRLEVENFFRDPAKTLDPYNTVSDSDKWNKIAQLARDLVSSTTQARVSQS